MESTQLKRIGAIIIDLMIIGALTTIIESLFATIFRSGSFELFDMRFDYKIGATFLLYVCYFLFFDLIISGRTIGKLIFGVLVVLEDEMATSRTVRLKRSLLKILSIIILPIAVLLFLFKNYYTIHDHYSGTMTVIKSQN